MGIHYPYCGHFALEERGEKWFILPQLIPDLHYVSFSDRVNLAYISG